MFDDLSEFFNLIEEGKNQKRVEVKSLVGDLDIKAVFTEAYKPKNKNKKVEEIIQEQKEQNEVIEQQKQVEEERKDKQNQLFFPLTEQERLQLKQPQSPPSPQQDYVTQKDLADHYRSFLGRVQREIQTFSGSGETRLEFLDDTSFSNISNHDVITYHQDAGDYGAWVNDPGVQRVVLEVRNNSGSDISAGTPVYQTGYNSGLNRLNIAPSDASIESTMPAKGLVYQDIANNETGFIIVSGEVDSVNTSSFNLKDELYVASGGGLTTIRPTGATDKVQKIGVVIKKSNNGSILVQGAGRSNDVPNTISIASSVTASAFYLTTGASIGGTVFDQYYSTNPGVATTTYTLTSSDYYVGINTTNAVTVTIPASLNDGKVYVIKDESGEAGNGLNRNITITPSGGETVDGQSTAVINQNYGSLTIIKATTNWSII
jgi:hypothetical protein